MRSAYDDSGFSYSKYWLGRQYEHRSEVIALRRLLKGHRFTTAADVGGGYGRLTPTLAGYCRTVSVVEPSTKLRTQAAKNFPVVAGTAQDTNLPPSSQDLVISIRVLHHLPDLSPTFSEFFRVLKPGKFLLIEFANSANFKARVRSFLNNRPLLLVPVDIRSPQNIRKKTIPFVNHHPHTVLKLLRRHGFQPLRILSVSNFRSPFLKKILPLPILLFLESVSQSLLSSIYFGPSIFVLATKVDNR